METKSYNLEELAKLTETTLVGDCSHLISNVADLESATDKDASFFVSPPHHGATRYEQMMLRSAAGVVFIDPKTPVITGRNFLISENPSLSFQTLIDHLFSDAKELTGFLACHPTAVIHPSAKIGNDVTIGPHAVIDKNVTIGSRSKIGAGAYIGPNSTIGEECQVHPHVTIRERCSIGNRVILQPGAVIGSCGFGYTPDKLGRHIKLNQVGTVTIEDLVQIGHGVEIGEDNIIIAQAGIAGSSKTGKHVILAGKVAVAGHIELDDGVMVAALSGVSKSLKRGKYNGIPAVPAEEYNRTTVHLRNIEKTINRLKELEKRLEQLEASK
jgi:UDP-3-O-[3-hydroxymyristoyl] glucosamine N-acyltransferase